MFQLNCFNFNGNYFIILWWIWPYINMNCHRYTCVPPILKPPPTSLPTLSLWVVPEHWLSVPCPASCLELAPVIYFTYGNEFCFYDIHFSWKCKKFVFVLNWTQVFTCTSNTLHAKSLENYFEKYWQFTYFLLLFEELLP